METKCVSKFRKETLGEKAHKRTPTTNRRKEAQHLEHKKSVSVTMSKHLAEVGACYRQDLATFGAQYAREDWVRKIIADNIAKGDYLVQGVAKENKSAKKKDYDVISLTRQGKIKMLNNMEEDEEHFRTYYGEKESKFSTIQVDKLQSALMLARIEKRKKMR